MDFFKGVGDFFRGAFKGNDDEEKKRKQEEARRKAQQQQQAQQQKPKTQNVNQLFGQKDIQLEPFKVKTATPQLQQNKPPVVAPKPEVTKPTTPKPAVDPNQYNEIKQKALGYQKPKVQDVNNYYGSDLKVLQAELAKGDKADIMRVQGLMTSLDNRTKELREFHKQRGESQSFKSARDLEQTVKSTRGDWTKENQKLKQFWDGVSRNEKNDFIEFLNERGVVKPADQRKAAVDLMDSGMTIPKPQGSWRNGNGQLGATDFTKDKERIVTIKQRQEIADLALSDEYKDVPLDQLGNTSFQQYLDAYNRQDAFAQRKILENLEKTLRDNERNYSGNEDLQRKVQQTAMLYNVLEDRGKKKENFGTKAQDVGGVIGAFGGALIESPKKVVQSADTLRREAFMGGKTRAMEIDEDYRKGKLTPEEYNKQLNDDARSLEWAGDGSGGRGQDALKALGIGADTVATVLPIGSIVKGARAANAYNKLVTNGVKAGLTKEAAEAFAREEMKALVKEGARDSLKKTVAKEAGINAGWSAAGSLREGEINPEQMLTETAFGAGIGGAAPVIGSGATRLWNRLRNGRQIAPELIEDAGRAAKPLDEALSTDRLTGDIADELRAIINDPTTPPFQKKRAQEILDTQKRDPEIPQTGVDRPAYLVKQDIERIIRTEEDNLNRYLSENPDLTDAQRQAAAEAAQQRVITLTDELKANRLANEAELGDLVSTTDENIQQQQQVNQEVADQQAASGAPAPGDPVTPEGGSPEVEANDAYGAQYTDTFDMTDEILRQAEVDTTKGATKESGLKKFFHKAAGGLISDPYKAMIDKIHDAVGDAAYSAAQGNIFTSAAGRAVTLFSNNAALKDSLKQIMRIRNDAQTAAGDAVKRLHDDISDKIARLNMPPEQFNQLLDRVFETPEFLARKYGDEARVSVESLPPEVRQVVDKLIETNKLRNLALFRQGKISQGEYQMFADGMHSPRLYDFEKAGIGSKGNKLIDTTSTKKRKDLDEISDETFEKLIESPAQRMLIRLEMAMRSNASNDALKAFDDAGLLLDRAPNNQFSKLEGARWGNYQGKYVYNPIKGQLEDGIVMNTDAGKAFGDLLDQYRNSPFGKVDRFMKKTKTVYSPGTFIGNVLSNPLLFNTGAGVNPFAQAPRMAKAGADLVSHRTGKAFSADIYEAQRYGVFSSDTGKQISGENNPQLSVANNKRTNPFEAAYGGADDAAKLAIWRGLRRRGVAPELAARRVAQFTQDYNNAGRLVRSLADMPVLGKPFARFAPELVRLVKNNMMYNPVGMVAGVAGIAMIQDELSSQAGETPEEREAREAAMGQTLIPGTAWINKMLTGTDRDISLNFAVPEGSPILPNSAINIARAVGLNFPQDESGDPNMALIKSLVPWAIPTRENAQGETDFAPEELFTSLAWSPIAQQVADRDFMGRQISDPTNKTYYEDGDNSVRKFSGENPDSLIDRAKHLGMSYVPLANEIGAVGSALMGGKDYYGKERTVPEAVARMFGLKTESNDAETRESRVDTKQYFDEDLAAVQDFVTQNPDLADAYFKYRNPTRNRITNQKESDLVSPERWDIINTDTSGRMFNFLKEQAIKQNQDDGKPLDPIFQLPEDQARYATELRSRPTGDDEEAKDILRATSDWYENFENKYFDYLDANSKYYDNIPKSEGAAEENPRVAAYGEASVPVVMPDVIKEYYRIKEADPEGAKQVYKANKELLSTAFDKYASDKLDRINKLRKIEGYEPISLETYKNKTFGFDADGGGFSFGGGGGGGAKEVNTLGELSNFTGGVKGLDVEAPIQEMPNTVALFQKLMATRSGGRTKPTLGASSRGQ